MLRQDVVSTTFRGDPFQTWAGPVSVALGGEYRREHTDFQISIPAQNFRAGDRQRFAVDR